MTFNIANAQARISLDLKTWVQNTAIFQSSEILSYIDNAINDYSMYRPNTSIQTIPIVASQQMYDFPSGVFDIEPICFFSADDPLSFYSLENLTSDSLLAYCNMISLDGIESPALMARFNTYNSKLAERAFGKMRIDKDLRKIVLYPIPSVSSTGSFICHSFHQKNNSLGTYDTVLDSDQGIITEYAEGLILDTLAMAYSAQAQKTGDREVKGTDIAKFLMDRADMKKKAMIRRISKPVVVRS